jgi:hypothetical protein
MKVANGALAAILFFILVLMIPDDVPFKIPFQKFFKIVVFLLGRRDMIRCQMAGVAATVVWCALSPSCCDLSGGPRQSISKH